MEHKKLLADLLAAESEDAAINVLENYGLLNDKTHWRPLGNMPNNQSVVHAQQSSPVAALVEKFTNGLDAILLRHCKAADIDPRSAEAPESMSAAVLKYFGDLSDKTRRQAAPIAEENLVLYATGSKARPCISIYDAGEGQLPQDFPSTFCSLVYGSQDGAYKGAIPFVQGRFNMGGTGVLPFCGDKRKMQLIVSRVPDDVAKKSVEWGFTVFCFFPSDQNPSWCYLTDPSGAVFTAGTDSMALLPKVNAESGEVCPPRERTVESGTLIKMYDYKAPKSNICGELAKKLEEYLLRPALPMRIIECREGYKANVMRVTVWDRIGSWKKNKLEEGFHEGASIQVKLESGEVMPAEIRVFTALDEKSDDAEKPHTGLRALINGQSHAKRSAAFFATKSVDLEHIAGSILVTLDCSKLGQTSRNALFMSNRETFRDDPLLIDMFKKIQKELKHHEGLVALNQKRYEEKIANATTDDDGISALEELLSSDPSLAELFGSKRPGKVAAKGPNSSPGTKKSGEKETFYGKDFPSYFQRADSSTSVEVDLPKGGFVSATFRTDVKNNYFSRDKHRGSCKTVGAYEPTLHLFNGRLTLTFRSAKSVTVGETFESRMQITDDNGSGPFDLIVKGRIIEPKEKKEREPRKEHKTDVGPSRPEIKEKQGKEDEPPLTIERASADSNLQIVINTGSKLLAEAKEQRSKSEEAAVEFVFKYGLALIAMGLIEKAKLSDDWKTENKQCREKIQETTEGIARVIVPLCLTLPNKLPQIRKAA